MVRGVIFDMDGLMFDTERLATVLWNQVGDELRIDMTEEFLDSFRGQNPTAIRNAFLQRFGREFDFDGCMGRKDELQHRYIEEKGVPLKEGLPELLEYLKGQDIRMAVATSTQQSLAEKMLKIAGVYEYFDAVAYGNKVKRSKPFPDIFQKAAEAKVEITSSEAPGSSCKINPPAWRTVLSLFISTPRATLEGVCSEVAK